MTDTDDRWGVIDERSIAEAHDLIGVPLRRDRMQWNEFATADAIRQFADGVGDDNPLWRDREYAATAGLDQPLAPPSFLYAVDATIVAPKLPGVQWIYARTRWRWYDVVKEGDVVKVKCLAVDGILGMFLQEHRTEQQCQYTKRYSTHKNPLPS